MTTTKRGFYGNDDHTVYVTPSGRIWCVQTIDAVELPRLWHELPDDMVPCDDLMTVEEMADHLKGIQDESGEILVEEG